MKTKELIEQVTGFVESDGYEVIDTLIGDYGRTIKLVLEKAKKKFTVPIKECFFDTDSEGKRTIFHGIIDIRDSLWYKNHVQAQQEN